MSSKGESKDTKTASKNKPAARKGVEKKNKNDG